MPAAGGDIGMQTTGCPTAIWRSFCLVNGSGNLPLTVLELDMKNPGGKTTIKLPSATEARTIGRKRFAAISAVEGLELSSEGRKRVSSDLPANKKRAEVLRAYAGRKDGK